MNTDQATTANVTSADGTQIAYSAIGSGSPVVLVDGAFGYRAFGPNPELAEKLAPHFTVYTYDRRGRGESGDTKPAGLSNEIDDLRALIEAIGEPVRLYGISSGAALAIEAAAAGLPTSQLAVFEAPFVVDDSRKPIPADYTDRLDALLAADDRAGMIKLFMKEAVGVPAFGVFMMQFMPAWKDMKGVAHTLPYDAAVLGDTGSGKALAPGRWPIDVPTLVVGGTKSPQWMQNSVRQLSQVLPNATLQMLPGQNHMVKAEALAPVLIDFFRD